MKEMTKVKTDFPMTAMKIKKKKKRVQICSPRGLTKLYTLKTKSQKIKLKKKKL